MLSTIFLSNGESSLDIARGGGRNICVVFGKCYKQGFMMTIKARLIMLIAMAVLVGAVIGISGWTGANSYDKCGGVE
jgi:hypothetical protein